MNPINNNDNDNNNNNNADDAQFSFSINDNQQRADSFELDSTTFLHPNPIKWEPFDELQHQRPLEGLHQRQEQTMTSVEQNSKSRIDLSLDGLTMPTSTSSTISRSTWAWEKTTPSEISKHIKPKSQLKKHKSATLTSTNSSVRKRILTACETCRNKKIKCDLNKPTCTNCIKFSMNCIYRQTNIEPVIQPKPIIITPSSPPMKSLFDDGDGTKEFLKKTMSFGTGTTKPVWTSCNWLANSEHILSWAVYQRFDHAKKIKSINARLSSFSALEKEHADDDDFKFITHKDMHGISEDIFNNIESYITNYIKFIHDKNPFVDSEKLRLTLQFIQESKGANLFQLKFSSELIPLVNLILICSCSLLSKRFDFKNLDNYKDSKEEKAANFGKSLKLFQLAKQLQASFNYRLDDFYLNIIQFYLLSSTFYMLNMKPLQTWDLIHRASIRIITILESLKNSDQKFAERDFKSIEKVFFTCFKYESELRVELSPLVPSSGIVNYPFPSLYPAVPPIKGSSVEEQTSWFYYLTELGLRKMENRILDEFYTIRSSSKSDSREGEFVSDNYSLSWDNEWTLQSTIFKVGEFLEDIKKIENQMLIFLKPSLSQLDQNSLTAILKPHGFILKDFLNEADLIKMEKDKKKQQNKKSLTKDSSIDTNSNQSIDDNNMPKEEYPDVPEVLNYIKTRMIVLKTLLFRPVLYLLYKMSIPELTHTIANNTFLKNLIQQGVESLDHLSVPLATHRHFGSWFYLRNAVSCAIIFFGMYLKIKEQLVPKEKIRELFKKMLAILNYWIEECPEFRENIALFEVFLREIENGE